MWPFVVPDSARIVSQACRAWASDGRPSATPPRTVPQTRLRYSTSRSGCRVTPLTVVPRVSIFGPSATICSATAPKSRSTTARFGIVVPGTGSHSPYFQSSTRPPGCAVSPGVSCSSGVATRSLRTPRCRAASGLKAFAMEMNVS